MLLLTTALPPTAYYIARQNCLPDLLIADAETENLCFSSSQKAYRTICDATNNRLITDYQLTCDEEAAAATVTVSLSHGATLYVGIIKSTLDFPHTGQRTRFCNIPSPFPYFTLLPSLLVRPEAIAF